MSRVNGFHHTRRDSLTPAAQELRMHINFVRIVVVEFMLAREGYADFDYSDYAILAQLCHRSLPSEFQREYNESMSELMTRRRVNIRVAVQTMWCVTETYLQTQHSDVTDRRSALQVVEHETIYDHFIWQIG